MFNPSQSDAREAMAWLVAATAVNSCDTIGSAIRPWAVVAQRDQTVRKIDLRTMEDCWTAKVGHHSARPQQIAISSDGSRVLTRSIFDEEFSLRVWDADDGRCIQCMQGFDVCSAIAADGEHGFSGRFCPAFGASLVKFRLDSGRYVDSFRLRWGQARALAMASKQAAIFVGSDEGKIDCVEIDGPHGRFASSPYRMMSTKSSKISQIVADAEGNRGIAVSDLGVYLFDV